MTQHCDFVNDNDRKEWDVDPTRFWRPRRPSISNNNYSSEDFYPGGFSYKRNPEQHPTAH
jgi:hypothetical protein